MDQFNKKRETPPPSQFDLKRHIEAFRMFWKGKKKEEEKGFVKTLKDIWNGEEEKRRYEFPFLNNKIKDEKSWIQKALRGIDPEEEPVGVAGVGCAVGHMVGFGVTGSHFLGPRFSLSDDGPKFVFGYGSGCGIGIGHGHGFGLGYFWDLPDESERIVIQTR